MEGPSKEDICGPVIVQSCGNADEEWSTSTVHAMDHLMFWEFN